MKLSLMFQGLFQVQNLCRKFVFFFWLSDFSWWGGYGKSIMIFPILKLLRRSISFLSRSDLLLRISTCWEIETLCTKFEIFIGARDVCVPDKSVWGCSLEWQLATFSNWSSYWLSSGFCSWRSEENLDNCSNCRRGKLAVNSKKSF